jgi:aminopeptidase N
VTHCIAAPVRDFAIQASPSFRVIERQAVGANGDAVNLRVAFAAGQSAAAERALVYMADAFAMYEPLYGAYPYRTLTVFQTTTRVGGVEYPMLAGVTPQPRDEAFFEWLVAHEVAHQWWYGLVGSDPLREAWLDESLAQYTTLLYVRARNGEAAAARLRARFFTGRYAREVQDRGDNRPGRPTAQFSRAAYGPMIYGKAPLFFDEVRTTLGDEAFVAWVRRYAADNRYRLVGPDALLAAADASGAGPQVRASYAKWIAATGE